MATAWEPHEYGDAWAEVYDEVHAPLMADAAAAVAFLTSLLPPRARILELGVGTGRIAIPLAGAGFAVTGLDASKRMLDALAVKPGGERVTAVLGDMADPPLDGPFDLVLLAFNTLFALPDQQAQLSCVRRAAELLGPGGQLVVEAAIPEPGRFAARDHDAVAQTVMTTTIVVAGGRGLARLPVCMRYAWPGEIDLMARSAGLARVERWGGWAHEPFDATSTRHVSLYQKRGNE